MIMRARQDRNIIVLELEGHLDFETSHQFKETCLNLMKKLSTNQMVFNLAKLKFVGSCGINQFVKVLKEFNNRKDRPKFYGVSSEFTRILRALQAKRNPFEICENETDAIESFLVPPSKNLRKKPLDH